MSGNVMTTAASGAASSSGGGILGGIYSAAVAANPVLGAVGAIAGFFTSIGSRRRAKRQAQARKARSIKSENLLLGAAGNVVQDVKQQGEFVQQGFDLGQQSGVRDYRQGVQSVEDFGSRLGFARSGAVEKSSTYLQEQFQLGQEQASLGLASEQYQLEQQKESRLRDIQGSLLELSAYSGRNINVLDMYNIS